MTSRIEDYALIGDTQTVALVANDGSIDWFCAPRFDSGACFAALLGTEDHGHWRIGPVGGGRAVRRRYRPNTLVLETEFAGDGGTFRVVDCMPIRDQNVDVVRLVEGVEGEVEVEVELKIRFDYGSVVPWVESFPDGLRAVGGPDALALHTPVQLVARGMSHIARFTVRAGEVVPFGLTWYPSHHHRPNGIDAQRAVDRTTSWWEDWSARSTYDGDWPELVQRSAITLKALTYAPTGGMIAAATTSLPEWIGSVRNWDYRYCWLRDATFSLYSLLSVGYVEEAGHWRDWLLRAVAGAPDDLQIMYGPSGERRLTELELPWLPGYEGSAPVRIGNAASDQFQLDVYGEVADALLSTLRAGIPGNARTWPIEASLLDFLEEGWRQPDEGIWEVRGGRQHFTHSKVMAWVAFDRIIKNAELLGLDLDLSHWRGLRDQVHADVCAHGYDATRNTFVQAYGSNALDASLLMIPLVGFLPPDDPRVQGTVAAITTDLLHGDFVMRYDTEEGVDGLPPGEGAFLPCSFWLADNLALMGRTDEARALFERLIALGNDLGLFAEEYDPVAGRLLGNFPQAMTHVALINTACNLSGRPGPAAHRAGGAMGAGISMTASQMPIGPGPTS